MIHLFGIGAVVLFASLYGDTNGMEQYSGSDCQHLNLHAIEDRVTQEWCLKHYRR